MLAIIFAALTLAISSDAAEAADAEPAQASDVLGQGASSAKVVDVPSSHDDVETQKILTSLATQSGWFPDVRISVKNGMVTLDGKAKNADQLAWLAKTADRLPAVIAVINRAQLETKPVTDLSPAWNEFQALVDHTKRALPLILIALVMFTLFYFAGRYISRGVSKLWSRRIDNPFLLSTVTKVTMVPIWILFFYMTLQTAGLSGLATTIIGGTGAVGIVLGFAFKDIAGNYLSGLLLAFRSPFTKGDLIVVGNNDYEGFVQNIAMRGTTILDPDGNYVLIPNSTVIQSAIKNKTANPETRLGFTIGIGYCDSYQKARELIETTLKEIPDILQKPDILIGLDTLSASSADIKIYFWINIRKSNGMAVKAEAISRVKEALLANGFTLPDPSREVVFTDALKIQTLESSDQAAADSDRRSEDAKKRAEKNLWHAKTKPQKTDNSHEEDVRALGGGVDLLDAGSRESVPASSSAAPQA